MSTEELVNEAGAAEAESGQLPGSCDCSNEPDTSRYH